MVMISVENKSAQKLDLKELIHDFAALNVRKVKFC
jgi:hypothetical protein